MTFYSVVVILSCLIYLKGKSIMSSIEEIKSELEEVKVIVSNVSGDVDSLIAQVAALKAQIESGTVVSQEDLDAIGQAAAEIKASLSGVDNKEPQEV